MTHPLNLRLAIESLADARARNAFAFLGLAIGIGAVVAMIGLTLIVRGEALRQFDGSGLDVLVVRKVSAGAAAGRPTAIDFDVIARLPAAVDGVELVAPVVERRMAVEALGQPTAQLPIAGVTDGYFTLQNLKVAAGRGLAALDEHAAVAVLGWQAAQAIRAEAPVTLLGETLTVGGRVFRVIGVLESHPGAELPASALDQAILLPASAVLRLRGEAEINTLFLRHDGRRSPSDAAERVTAYLQAQIPGLAVQVTGAEAIVAEMNRQLRLYAVFFGVIGGLALVLGGFAIMNGLLLAVAQRRTEIGLRRALGALRRDVQAQFMYEAVLLGGTGGATGVALGVVAIGAVTHYAGWEFSLPAVVPLVGLTVALVISAAAGFFPAFQAARLDPVVAMKPER